MQYSGIKDIHIIVHQSLEPFASFKTEILCPLNKAAQCLGNHQSHFSPYEFDCSLSGIIQNLSFGNWLISLSYAKAGEGNGNPLQYSCLAKPMDRGVW